MVLVNVPPHPARIPFNLFTRSSLSANERSFSSKGVNYLGVFLFNQMSLTKTNVQKSYSSVGSVYRTRSEQEKYRNVMDKRSKISELVTNTKEIKKESDIKRRLFLFKDFNTVKI